MRIIADFHIHSKFSRAVSQSMEPVVLDAWARRKGINVLGTGDFTHPGWIKELKEKLEPKEDGLFRLKSQISPSSRGHQVEGNLKPQTRFILSAEISCIYTKNSRTRKIHLLILAPDFRTVEKINAQLSWSANIISDGRPIIGMDAHDLAKLIFETDPRCMVMPAHIWTPWFSLFGSASGFDSIEECFEELTPQIFAFETGLSSDPEMNWRLSVLDKKTIISNSDAHSPSKLGREANVFEMDDLSYNEITHILKNNDQNKFKFTIEFYPEEGKYHFDGHRKCNVSFTPAESAQQGNICPKCGKHLTIGVLNRVGALADRDKPLSEGRVPFKSLVPLEEIIADIWSVGVKSKKVEAEYLKLTDAYCEFDILLDLPEVELKGICDPALAKGIIDAREGKVTRIPGYDGVFGIISVSGNIEKKRKKEKAEEKQMGLF